MEANVNMVTVLPSSFAIQTKSFKDDFNNDFETAMVEFNKGMQMVVEWPIEQTRKHLRPLHIKAHVNGQPVNKIIIDRGASVNLMPRLNFMQLGKQLKDFMPYNIVVIDFNGKVSALKEMVLVNLQRGTITRPTLFIIIPSRASYNLLLSQDWIMWYKLSFFTLH